MTWQQWFVIIWLVVNVGSSAYSGVKEQDFAVTLGSWIWLAILTSVLYTGGFFITH